MKLLTISDLCADLVVPIGELPLRPGKHQPSNQCLFVAGGTSNTLIVAARLGLNTHAVGAVGDDWLGKMVLQQLCDEDVSTNYVQVVPDATTTLSIELVDSSAQHVFVGALGKGTTVELSTDLDTILSRVEAVFCTSYALASHSLFSCSNSLDILKYAHKCSIPTFFDLGPAAFSIDWDIVEQAINASTVVLTTMEELIGWTGRSDKIQATNQILGTGAEIVVIKCGSEGCIIMSSGEEIMLEGFKVKVRDTAGAGDAFAGAFIFGYLNRYSLVESGTIANAAGAITVTRVGTGPYVPQRVEIFDMLESYGVTFGE
ncbi:MAG: carbohydrate kinase family protein [Anaerolineales bacterium]|nr:carbohydrate kinase family protein [Anaerolineales bacterium]